MKKKVVYITEWIARDSKKEYPHGWGFEPPIVQFPNDADPAWVGEICRQNLSNDEFECIGAIPRLLMDGMFEVAGSEIKTDAAGIIYGWTYEYPKNQQQYDKWKETLINQ